MEGAQDLVAIDTSKRAVEIGWLAHRDWAARGSVTGERDNRRWSLICQPRHIFAHQGPEFMEAQIWVVPESRVTSLETTLKEIMMFAANVLRDELASGLSRAGTREIAEKANNALTDESTQ